MPVNVSNAESAIDNVIVFRDYTPASEAPCPDRAGHRPPPGQGGSKMKGPPAVGTVGSLIIISPR